MFAISDWLILSSACAHWAGGGSWTPSAGGAQQNLHRRFDKYCLLGSHMTLTLSTSVPDTSFVLLSLVLPSFASPLNANFFFSSASPSPLDLPVLALLRGRLVDWAATHSGQSLVRQEILAVRVYWALIRPVDHTDFFFL